MNIPANAPRTATFQMRINPDVKQRAEDLFATYGLTLTDAVNVFLQQSLNSEGLPFLLSPENSEYLKGKAIQRLLQEVQKGWDSAERDGWVSMEEAEAQLGIIHE